MEIFSLSDLKAFSGGKHHAIVLGRFQPFHKGHLTLMNTALKHCENLTVVVGCTDKKDCPRNPLCFAEREKLIVSSMGARHGIFPLYDKPTDSEWLDDFFTMFQEGKKYLIFTGSLEDVEFFKDLDKPNFTLVIIDRFSEELKAYSGTRIRELQSKKDPLWKSLIPS
jgi:cytidyltransferase-like protein